MAKPLLAVIVARGWGMRVMASRYFGPNRLLRQVLDVGCHSLRALSKRHTEPIRRYPDSQ